MSKAPNGQRLDAAIAELEREQQVRTRCYPRWVTDGKLTSFEASERLERQEAAILFLKEYLDVLQGKTPIMLDTQSAAAAA